ncbi:hypothetical protein MHB42_03455 [Lysinibacillus sp. FSL K6-0232]|uniref:hypothetical protein n=1 Tax=Lysinibacillus sp. FSL K6-0232 TaxID=2921425 RepID=UPI0030FAC9B3
MEHLFFNNFWGFWNNQGRVMKLNGEHLQGSQQFVRITISLATRTVQACKEEPGYIFIYHNGKLYYGKMLELYTKDDFLELFPNLIDTMFTYAIKIANLQEMPVEHLKYLFAKSKRKYIGDADYSLYQTKDDNYPYATPIVDNTKDFFLDTYRIVNDFKEVVLYSNDTIQNRETYGKIVEEDGEIFVTLTNKKMLQVDTDYLLGEYDLNLPHYRPYFYEFMPVGLTTEKIEQMELERNRWYKVSLYAEAFVQDEFNERMMKGTLLFSASPLKRKGRQLVFGEEVSANIEQRFNQLLSQEQKNWIAKNDNDVRHQFERALNFPQYNDFELNVVVYSVGQGNWIQVKGIDKGSEIFSFCFDIGFTITETSKLHEDAIQQAAQEAKKSNLIMLSHWDLDHILGASKLDKVDYEKTWIVPQIIDTASESSKRLAAYLAKESNINTIFVADTFNGAVIFNNDYFVLGKGKGNPAGKKVSVGNTYNWKTKYNDLNNLGLILEVKNNGCSMLLPGDCEYIEFPSYFMKSYSIIVVPHHGATVNGVALPNKHVQCSEAIACVNLKKTKGYPKRDHVNILQHNKGYKVTPNTYYNISKTFKL